MSNAERVINKNLLKHARKEIEFLTSSTGYNSVFLNDSETIRKLSLSISHDTALESWWLAGDMFEGDIQKAHFYLFLAIQQSLEYTPNNSFTSTQAEEWKNELIATLKKTEALLRQTPAQYEHGLDYYRQETDGEILNVINNRNLSSSELDISIHRQIFEKIKPKWVATPIKTTGEKGRRAFFIRSMATSLNGMSNNEIDIIYWLVKALFEDDIQRKQIKSLIKDIEVRPAHENSPDYFSRSLYPYFLKNL